ncbi:MAG: HEPN domain-containing protein [Syntrophaceae bacterium]|jgi:HEPN domain-containing protein|nr:HEPN domain-containing protein [Syntrophaceae bacterium]
MEKNVKYWLDISEYDLETAEAMLEKARFLYVGFMCHQAIEKIVKAYYQQELNQLPPKAHNIILLAQQSNLYDNFSDAQKAFIEVLQPLNIEARYPDYRDRLLLSLNQDKCKNILQNTRELHQWIKEKLK